MERLIVDEDRISEAIDDVSEKLEERLKEKGNGAFVSKHEILGIITEEYQELIDEVRNDDHGLIHVRAELIDIAVGAIFAIASIDKECNWK